MSAARLPVPGDDGGTWGDILNEFLLVSHNDDGSLKAGAPVGDSIDEATLVHKAGAEIITGEKNFTGGLKVSNVSVITADDTRLTNTRTPTDGSVSTVKVQDGSITEAKLAIGNSPATGNALTWSGSGLSWEPQGSAPVTSVAGKTGVVSLVSADVGLNNVDNTTDANKPVSTATQTALDAKAASTHTHTASQVSDATTTGRSLLTTADASAARTTLGLNNVNNTSDTNKPISTATQIALDNKAESDDLALVATSGSYDDLTDKPTIADDATIVKTSGAQDIAGQKNFTGTLQAGGAAVVVTSDSRLTNTRTPSDDSVSTIKLQDSSVTEAKLSITNSPTSGDALTWNGTTFAWEAPSAAPVASVAGKTGVVTLVKGDVGLGNVDNTTDANKPVSTATQTALDGKAASSHTHTASNISDSTATGRSVITAADAAAARSAIGAGTSNLAIGTTGTTAKAGDYAPTKSDVGLGNVDNTSDANKPVSTATQTALNLKANTSALSAVATSGSYADLTNKPTIPTAGTSGSTYAAGNDTRITGAVQSSTATTKGDLLVASAGSTINRLGVGTNGQVLVADDSLPVGVKWATATSGGGTSRAMFAVDFAVTGGAVAQTDYVYYMVANVPFTLPTAVGNTNSYTVKAAYFGASVQTTSGQYIDGQFTTLTLDPYTSYVFYAYSYEGDVGWMIG